MELMKTMAIVLAVVLIVCFGPQGGVGSDMNSYMFTSYANLLKMYYMEEESLSNVDVFLREELLQHGDQQAVEEAHNLTSVKKLVEEAKKTHTEVGPKTKEYLSHPVNTFHLTQRLYLGWKEAIDLIRESKPCKEWHIPHVISRLANIEANLPTADEASAVAYNLVTIQHTQGLSTRDLLQGRVGPHAAFAPISPRQQFQVAKLAVEEDDYYYAAQWLKHLSKWEGLGEARKEEYGFNATNVLGMLASAYFRINMVPQALTATDQLLKRDPDNMVALSNKAFYESRLARTKHRGGTDGRPVRYGKDDTYRRRYEALCRGTNIKLSRFTCHLEPTWPGSRLSFHKMEVLRQKPPIVAFHDVLSRREAALIANVSDEEYEKAAMDSEHGFRTPEFTLVMSKVGRARHTPKKQHSKYLTLLSKIKRRLSALPYAATQPYTPGELEARNYGHQGFYVKPSPDFEIQSLGGHTGTAMMFLNDVERGGEVVFPSANARVTPQTGTVVFYFPSFKRFHAVCPVAYGTEWVLVRSYFEKRAPNFCRPHEDPAML